MMTQLRQRMLEELQRRNYPLELFDCISIMWPHSLMLTATNLVGTAGPEKTGAIAALGTQREPFQGDFFNTHRRLHNRALFLHQNWGQNAMSGYYANYHRVTLLWADVRPCRTPCVYLREVQVHLAQQRSQCTRRDRRMRLRSPPESRCI